MKKSLMLLINPNAGRSGYRQPLAEILEVFNAAGYRTTVFFTEKSGDATDFIGQFAPAYDRIVCMGGDGTLSETASGMIMLPQPRELGYIPLGTTNDVARTLGISMKPVEAARQLMKGKPVPMDLGLLGSDSYFTYVAAFGAFTEVSYETPQEIKKTLGHLAYMLEGARRISEITARHAIVEVNGSTAFEGDYLFGAVTNSSSVAGIVKLDNKPEDLSDGQFEVLLIEKPENLTELGQIITQMLNGNFQAQRIKYLRAEQIRFRFPEPVAWTRDGEGGGKWQDVTVRNVHPGISLFV